MQGSVPQGTPSDDTGVSVHYYNGDSEVNLFVVYDQIGIRLPQKSQKEAVINKLRASLPTAFSIIEETDSFVVVELDQQKDKTSPRERFNQTVYSLQALGYAPEAIAYPSHVKERSKEYRKFITNQLSVKLKEKVSIEQVTSQYGLTIVEQVSYSPRTYIMESCAGILSALETANALYESGYVEFATPLIRSYMVPRSVPNDPLFQNQWHLLNLGPPQVSGGTAGNDVNISTAWDTVTGAGVNIGITDDGLQENHPDLAANVRQELSHDYFDGDDDPSPGSSDFHGTSVAGVAAAKGNNSLGVTGAAFDACLVGIRLTSGYATDNQIASAMNHLVSGSPENRVSINSNSWGPADSGDVLETFGPLTLAAIQNGITNGRGGLGTIYVWAAGNGRQNGDNTNFDGYASSRYTIAIGASGANGVFSYYSEPGASMLVNCPSSDGSNGITTTDITGSNGYSSNDYTNSFGGTSSATPLASGIIALMLEANPNLTWRDVQHILVDTATKNNPSDPGWKTNGSSRLFHHAYGFGRINAAAAVQTASTWTNVPAAITSPLQATVTTPLAIPDNNPTGISQTAVISHSKALFTEHVEVTVNINHTYRGDLEIVLTAPSGMQSVLATSRDSDSGDDFSNWTFTSVAHWGEDPRGTWTLQVADLANQDTGTLNNWTLKVYGYEIGGTPSNQPPVLNPIGNKTVSQGEVLTIPLSATDPDGDPLIFSSVIAGITAGYSIYQNVFTWDTTGVNPGNYAATFTVREDKPTPLEDSETITIIVTPGCTQPDPPASITASQGTFADRIRITYAPVDGAVSYWVYRNTTPDPESADLIAVWNETTLDDFSVETGTPPFSCAGLAPFVRGPNYYYWVSAYNGCDWSEKSGPALGYAGGLNSR